MAVIGRPRLSVPKPFIPFEVTHSKTENPVGDEQIGYDYIT